MLTSRMFVLWKVEHIYYKLSIEYKKLKLLFMNRCSSVFILLFIFNQYTSKVISNGIETAIVLQKNKKKIMGKLVALYFYFILEVNLYFIFFILFFIQSKYFFVLLNMVGNNKLSNFLPLVEMVFLKIYVRGQIKKCP